MTLPLFCRACHQSGLNPLFVRSSTIFPSPANGLAAVAWQVRAKKAEEPDLKRHDALSGATLSYPMAVSASPIGYGPAGRAPYASRRQPGC